MDRVVSAPRLARWDKVFEEFSRKETKIGSPPRVTIDMLYPAIAEWVRSKGWIEIGDQEGFGFIVRALDYGGLVFESKKPKTLSQAMAALEKKLVNQLEDK